MYKGQYQLNRWLLTCWLLLAATTLTTGFTPLTFTSLVARNTCWLLALASSFVMMPALARYVRNQIGRLFIRWLPAIVVAGFIVLICLNLPWSLLGLANGLSSHWQTVQITHRSHADSSVHIALQMLDVGARGYRRRTIRVQPITPLFYWLSEVPTSIDDKQWRAVREDFNPFNWKGA